MDLACVQNYVGGVQRNYEEAMLKIFQRKDLRSGVQRNYEEAMLKIFQRKDLRRI